MMACCCSLGCGIIYWIPPDRGWIRLVRCCVCECVCFKSAGKLSFPISAENVTRWKSLTARARLNNECVSLRTFFTLTFHRINCTESNSQCVTSDPHELQRNPSAPRLSKKPGLTWSPLRLKILESSMILQDQVSLFFPPFWFSFYKATKFRHFLGSPSTWRKLHYSVLAPPFYVNKWPCQCRLSRQVSYPILKRWCSFQSSLLLIFKVCKRSCFYKRASNGAVLLHFKRELVSSRLRVSN